jgi:peptidoglycan/LPS O-acetylase OafA/YrhL
MGRQFTALRGIAIILVVLSHTIDLGTTYLRDMGALPEGVWVDYLLSALFGLGLLAVPTFLFLSGCFLAYALRSDSIRSNYKIVRANLKHILIPYVIWSIIFYIEVYFLHGKSFSPVEWVKNLLVGYPFNFVPLLVFYYLIAPLLLWAGKRIGWLLILLIGVYQLFLINVAHAGVLGFQFPAWAEFLAPPVLFRTMADWAIFFPFGLIYVIKARTTLPRLERWKWVFVLTTVALYVLAILSVQNAVNFPLAIYLFPVTFIPLAPVIRRDAIPLVRQFELFGKRAYGLYLMNLIVLDITLYTIQTMAPGLFSLQLLLLPVLFALALAIPMLVMGAAERAPKPGAYRLVFG